MLHTCTNKSLLNCRHCRFYAHRIDWRVPICCKLKLAYKISVVCKRTRTSLQKEIGTNIDKLGHLTPQVGHVTATQTAKTSQTRTHMLQLSSTCEHMFIQEIGWKTCFAEHVWSNFLRTVGKKTLTWYFLNGIDTLFYKKIKCYISRTSMINYRVSYFLGEGFVNSSQITHMVILKDRINITEYDAAYISLHCIYICTHILTFRRTLYDSIGLILYPKTENMTS